MPEEGFSGTQEKADSKNVSRINHVKSYNK